jgi:hypothetical protein
MVGVGMNVCCRGREALPNLSLDVQGLDFGGAIELGEN